jgi:hypothetical protein
MRIGLGVSAALAVAMVAVLVTGIDSIGQVFSGRPELDRSKPVPPKPDILKAWQRRQDSVRSFQFAWTEQQIHPKGWLPNPRYRQHEWLNTPGLLIDRNYTVTKTLAVDGNKMRYSFEFDRKEEPDGVRVNSNAGNTGLGEGKHYVYTSTFDGQTGTTIVASKTKDPPAATTQTTTNVDAQNLDTRAILMAFRPLDPVMGDLLVERAVTNLIRTMHRGKSTFLLEEERDPSGWKTILRIEPERDFLITQLLLPFEQKPIIEVDIDYIEDTKWGWIPNGWRITQMLNDGTKRQLVEAKVTSYTINQPIAVSQFD